MYWTLRSLLYRIGPLIVYRNSNKQKSHPFNIGRNCVPRFNLDYYVIHMYNTSIRQLA